MSYFVTLIQKICKTKNLEYVKRRVFPKICETEVGLSVFNLMVEIVKERYDEIPKEKKSIANAILEYYEYLQKDAILFERYIKIVKSKANVITKKKIIRRDICLLMLEGNTFENIISLDNSSKSIQGFIYETICEILVVSKCILELNYNKFYRGRIASPRPIKMIEELLNKPINQGDNPVDILIQQNEHLIPISIKYRDDGSETDVKDLDGDAFKTGKPYKIALIMKDKKMLANFRHEKKEIHEKVKLNGLLLDRYDIIKGLDTFQKRYSNLEELIEDVNKNFLLHSKKPIIRRLHQELAFLNFIEQLNRGQKLHAITHKPRSGKSILILLLCKYLFTYHSNKKILIMTAVPSTIDSFINDLKDYSDFTDLNFKIQTEDDFEEIEDDFEGIVFASLQYFKINPEKKEKQLLKLKFDTIFTDECHIGGATKKTNRNILNIVDSVKTKVFVSGTADEAIDYYNIKSCCIYKWEIEDEGYMKNLMNDKVNTEEKEVIKQGMISRHGNNFEKCLYDETLNKDYSKFPIQVLMKYQVDDKLLSDIENYNRKIGDDTGFSVKSLFALKEVFKNNKKEYIEQFQITSTPEGKNMMKQFLKSIIDSGFMGIGVNKNTLMKNIEKIQSKYGSRQSDYDNPLMFIIYLPTNTGNNTIDKLQSTLVKFLKDNEMWTEYNIEFANSKDDSCDDSSDKYIECLENMMKKTKEKGKKGCILLLGNKGGTGITYKECDVTISLDDGHNLNSLKQKFSRAGTEAEGKKIFINVDFNIQRTYLFILDKIKRFKKITKNRMTNAEVLYYLYEQNIFLYNPLGYDNKPFSMKEIKSYYENEAQQIVNITNIKKTIDLLLDNIYCEEDPMGDYISVKSKKAKYTDAFIGENLECPKPGKKCFEEGDIILDEKDEKSKKEDDLPEENNEDTNNTLELSKILFPLFGFLSSRYSIKYIDIMTEYEPILSNYINEKKIIKTNINKSVYNKIKKIMDELVENETNQDILDDIKEIYSTAEPDEVRELIAKHFIPSEKEEKDNAEIPTPVVLVNDMLDKIPEEFWFKPNTVFEPCCGKGNFVLGIFDKFFNGLVELYPDNTERCRIIVEKLIYYADITYFNVFITTELLKAHVESKNGGIKLNYKFNSNVGDTLTLNIKKKWGIEGFDAVIGNPPYNSPGKTATGNAIWFKFVLKSLEDWLNKNGYLCFVHPSGWRKPPSEKARYDGLFDLMTRENQMLYLEIHDTKDGMRVFKKGTRYDWYVIQKKKSNEETIVVDEKSNIINMYLKEWLWLPNYNFNQVKKLLAKEREDTVNILFSASIYETRKKWMSKKETEEFKYKCIHSTPQQGVRYYYSKVDKGHFGIPKVIFGDSGIYNAIVDSTGEYCMTQHAIAIVDDIENLEYIKQALETDSFKDILKACLFGNFQIDWRLFTYFKKDFWKEFL
jgi:hypothetical protein